MAAVLRNNVVTYRSFDISLLSYYVLPENQYPLMSIYIFYYTNGKSYAIKI